MIVLIKKKLQFEVWKKVTKVLEEKISLVWCVGIISSGGTETKKKRRTESNHEKNIQLTHPQQA